MDLVFLDNTLVTVSNLVTFPSSILSLTSTETSSFILSTEGRLFAYNKPGPIYSISFPSEIKSISCGRAHACLLTTYLEVFTWGSGESGALGLGTTISYDFPQPLKLSEDTLVSQISCGAWHTALLVKYQTGSNFLLAMGRNTEGQLGTGTLSRELLPIKVKTSENIEKVVCGTNHTLVLGESKCVYATGDNRFGQLGLGHKRKCVAFCRISEIEAVSDIACGHHSAAISKNQIYVWGTGTFGEFLVPTLLQSKEKKIFCNSIMKIEIGDCIGGALDGLGNLWAWGCKNNEKNIGIVQQKCIDFSLNAGVYACVTEKGAKINNDFKNTRKSLIIPQNERIVSPGLLSTQKKKRIENLNRKSFCIDDLMKSEKRYELHSKTEIYEENDDFETKKLKDIENKVFEELQNRFSEEFNEKLRLKEQEFQNFRESLLSENQKLYQDNRSLFEQSQKLKQNLEKMASENDRLLKSFHSDSEIKLFYENILEDLDKQQKIQIEGLENELITLRMDNENIQELLAKLRQENLILCDTKETANKVNAQLSEKISNSTTIIQTLETKIQTLEEQLSDLTAANHKLYQTIEKLNDRSPEKQDKTEERNEEVQEEEENFHETFAINIKRNGLASIHQEKMQKIAAKNMKFDDPPELRSNSPSSPKELQQSIRKKKDSFEDVRNKVKDLKNNRKNIQIHMNEFEKRFIKSINNND